MYSHRNPNIYLFVYLFTYIAYINTPSNPKRDRIVGNLEIMGKHHLHHPGNVPTYLFGGYYSIPFHSLTSIIHLSLEKVGYTVIHSSISIER
jgi:hypothetical protein